MIQLCSDPAILDRHLISSKASLLEALGKLNRLRPLDSMTLFAIDETGQLVGSLTDGDIRRRLLISQNLEETVSFAMNPQPKHLRHGKMLLHNIVSLRDESGIGILPVTKDERTLVELIDLREFRSFVPVHAVLMAGGEGQRLRPLTSNCPKPMLEVAGAPILQHTVERLRLYGIRRITVCVRYLSEQITSYFGDGSAFGVEMDYVHEDDPLGTLGGACGICYEHEDVLVMNADIITNIDFEDFFLFHERTASLATVASFQRTISIPCAVLGADDFTVESIEEKPEYAFWCNAGVYLFKAHSLAALAMKDTLHATDAMTLIREDGGQVSLYPMYAYWKDLGTVTDLTQARHEFPYIKF